MRLPTINKRSITVGIVGLAVLALGVFLWQSAGGPGRSSEAATQGTEILQASGKVTGLRVHDVGTGYGPPSDRIDGEVVFWLGTPQPYAARQDGGGGGGAPPTPAPAPAAPAPSVPPNAFGFKLRNDTNGLTHQAMLDLLRGAFEHDWTVTVEYVAVPGKSNLEVYRVIVTR